MKKIILGIVLLFSVLGPWPVTVTPLTITSRAGISWESWLPAIAQAESDGYIWAVSRKGKKYGRGMFQISEIALTPLHLGTPRDGMDGTEMPIQYQHRAGHCALVLAESLAGL